MIHSIYVVISSFKKKKHDIKIAEVV